MNYLKNIFTGRDNTTFSAVKLIAITAALAMVCNFLRTLSVDFQGFGIGIGAMIAALAAKYVTEKPNADSSAA